jgi:hypothetical protein
MAVFWDVAQCSLVEIYRRFRRPYCLNRQGDRPDDRGSRYLWIFGKFLPDFSVRSSDRDNKYFSKSVNFYKTEMRKIPGNSHRDFKSRENLKSHTWILVYSPAFQSLLFG